MSKQRCAVCDSVLTVHQAVRGSTCDDPRCKRRNLLIDLARRREQEAQLMSRIKTMAETIRNERGLSSECEPSLVVVPVNEWPITQLQEKRRMAFVGHLTRILDQLEAEGWDKPGPNDAQGESGEEAMNAVIGGACAVCRGFCCRYGGNHALLKVETLRGLLDKYPGMSRAELMAAYMERVGGETYQGSCVFHGVTGCRLPREMRSKTCNDYLCKGLRDSQVEKPEEGVILIAAADGKKVYCMIPIATDTSCANARQSPPGALSGLPNRG